MSMQCVLLVLLLAYAHAKQFHLSLVGDGSNDYMVDWTTSTGNSSSILYVTTSSAAFELKGKNSGKVVEHDSSVDCWYARIPNLRIGDRITYSLNPNDSTPDQFEVKDASEITWAVMADMASLSQGGAAGVSLYALKEALRKGAYGGLLDIGDISYELTGKNGENYMNELADITSKVPFFPAVGNHEYMFAGYPFYTLQNYDRRFAGVKYGAGKSSLSNSNSYYSFNSGYIHFVFINTEIYGKEDFYTQLGDYKWQKSEHMRNIMSKKQKLWLKEDLSRVNRKTTPFIVLCGHRPPFKTPHNLHRKNNRFMKDIIPLLDFYSVDLILTGHVHAYYSIKETKFRGLRIPPVIVSGSAGNNDYIDKRQKVKLGFFQPRKNIEHYGYGYLSASAFELTWKWGKTSVDSGPLPNPSDWIQEDLLIIPKAKSNSGIRRQDSNAQNYQGSCSFSPYLLTAILSLQLSIFTALFILMA